MHDNYQLNIERDNLEALGPKGLKSQKTIYIVDDDMDDQFFCKMHLQQSRWVEEVKSFSSAIELFSYFDDVGIYEQDSSDSDKSIVLLDVHMPSVNGMEALDFIRTHPVTTDMNVILLTSDISADKIYEAYKLEATGYLQKPFSVKDFNEILSRNTRYMI